MKLGLQVVLVHREPQVTQELKDSREDQGPQDPRAMWVHRVNLGQ